MLHFRAVSHWPKPVPNGEAIIDHEALFGRGRKVDRPNKIAPNRPAQVGEASVSSVLSWGYGGIQACRPSAD
jgi:hypothetical protein